MTGADAPALRALAAQMSQSAARLDGIRQGVRSRLYSIQWDGPDGAAFRRAWDGQHVPMLARVAEGLRDSAERLLAEADQQDSAAGIGTGGLSMGPSTGSVLPADEYTLLERLDDFVDDAGNVLGGTGAVLSSVLAGYGVHVAAHVRADGTQVRDYWRWAAGHADSLNRLGSANAFDRAGDVLDRFDTVLGVAGFGIDAVSQWNEDEGEGYSDGERATRAGFAAGTSVLVEAGAERLGTAAGAAIGTAIFPGVGTVIGGAIGWAIASGLTDVFEDEIGAAGAAIGSAVWNTGEAVVDFGGDVLEAGGDLLGDLGEGAADLWEEWTPW